jgi:type IV pilus assembly protein PilC
MARFSYIATNSKGESIRGTLDASTKSEVIKALSSKGLFLVSCRTENDPGNAVMTAPMMSSQGVAPAPRVVASSPATGLNNSTLGSSTSWTPSAQTWWDSFAKKNNEVNRKARPRGKVQLKELVVLTRQLSISINAGMSFVDALQGMAQTNKNPVLAFTMRQVLDDVLSGKKFSEALAQHPEIFETFYVSMAAAGEAGGFMPDALNRIAEFLEKELELRGKIKSAMIYPIVIAAVATVVVIGMMTFIVPTFVKVFKEMNAPLPLPTQWLITVSNFTRSGGFLTPVIIVAGFYLMKQLRNRYEGFRVFYDQKVLKLPLFGKILTLEIITRFIRTLASLAENGVAILMSLSVARQVVGNRTIEKVVDEIYASVQQGNGISPVLYKSTHFPVLVANMVSTGEKTGSIPEVLTKMANYYDSEVASAVRDLLTLMEPLLIVVMAVIVGFVVAGLMLPTFEMSQLVQP